MESKEKELKDRIYERIPRNVLVCLNERPLTITEISKFFESNYGSVRKAVEELEKEGLVETEKRGRIKIVWLTEFGKRVSDLLIEIEETLEDYGNKRC